MRERLYLNTLTRINNSIRLIFNFNLLLLFKHLSSFMSPFLIPFLVPIDDDPLALILSELPLALDELFGLSDLLAVSAHFLLLEHLYPELDAVSTATALFVQDTQLFFAAVLEFAEAPHISRDEKVSRNGGWGSEVGRKRSRRGWVIGGHEGQR